MSKATITLFWGNHGIETYRDVKYFKYLGGAALFFITKEDIEITTTQPFKVVQENGK